MDMGKGRRDTQREGKGGRGKEGRKRGREREGGREGGRKGGRGRERKEGRQRPSL